MKSRKTPQQKLIFQIGSLSEFAKVSGRYTDEEFGNWSDFELHLITQYLMQISVIMSTSHAYVYWLYALN